MNKRLFKSGARPTITSLPACRGIAAKINKCPAASTGIMVPKINRNILPEEFFDLIPQRAVRTAYFPEGVGYDAIWDMARGPAGRIFVSLCGEGTASVCAKLYEYLRAENRFRFCFDVRHECMVYERSTPPSKIHTSMCLMNDGRLIMGTHTTARAPSHPFWLMESFYTHQWDGYQGANIIIFDPATGDARNLGIPVPRNSIYGGAYDPKHEAYYFGTFPRGHLYRLDIKTRAVKDLGQSTEYASFRYILGPDGHIYNSTWTGRLYRVNVDTQRIEDLGVEFRESPNKYSKIERQMNSACVGPDKRIYMSAISMDAVYAYDCKRNKLECMGNYEPAPRFYHHQQARSALRGMQFDSKGCLWYSVQGGVDTKGAEGVRWEHLASWDVLRGKSPVNIGLLGTKKRQVLLTCEMIIDKDILFLNDTNHLEDPPGVIAVDLSILKEDLDKPREISHDPCSYYGLNDSAKHYPGNAYSAKDVEAYQKFLANDAAFRAENPFAIQAEEFDVVRLWQTVPVDESSVQQLYWEKNGDLCGLCGVRGKWQFLIRDGKIVRIEKTFKSRNRFKFPGMQNAGNVPAFAKSMKLPSHPGRQFLSEISAWCAWKKNEILVGTKDAFLAKAAPSRKSAFSLGSVAPHGPIHQLGSNSSRNIAYGVAGDPQDVGQLFRYDDEQGVRELGRILGQTLKNPGMAGSCEPRCLAFSPDEQTLAIGVADRLGCVYLYKGLKN